MHTTDLDISKLSVAERIQRADISQSELARRMKTSRSAVERLLDPTNPSVTLSTLERAASAIGKRLSVRLTA
jgi:transcriptional regulator with XRE-family HTH domain